MFNSLSAGYIPICLIVVVIAWFIAKVRNIGLRVVFAFIVPIVVSFGWFFIPRLPKLFRPLQFGEDPWVGWGLIAAATWSIVAVPLSIASVVIFVLIRQRGKRSSNKS